MLVPFFFHFHFVGLLCEPQPCGLLRCFHNCAEVSPNTHMPGCFVRYPLLLSSMPCSFRVICVFHHCCSHFFILPDIPEVRSAQSRVCLFSSLFVLLLTAYLLCLCLSLSLSLHIMTNAGYDPRRAPRAMKQICELSLCFYQGWAHGGVICCSSFIGGVMVVVG